MVDQLSGVLPDIVPLNPRGFAVCGQNFLVLIGQLFAGFDDDVAAENLPDDGLHSRCGLLLLLLGERFVLVDFNLLEQRFQKGGKSLQCLLLVGGTEGFKRSFADGACGFGDGRDVLSRKRVVNPSVAVDDAQVFRRLIAVAVGGGDDSVACRDVQLFPERGRELGRVGDEIEPFEFGFGERGDAFALGRVGSDVRLSGFERGSA